MIPFVEQPQFTLLQLQFRLLCTTTGGEAGRQVLRQAVGLGREADLCTRRAALDCQHCPLRGHKQVRG